MLMFYFFAIFSVFWGWIGPKNGQKVYILNGNYSLKIRIFQRLLKLCFYLQYYIRSKTSPKLDYIWGSKVQKTLPEWAPMDADLVCKTLKICNLTTTKAILMKLYSNLYLCKIFHLKNTWGRILTASENANMKSFLAYVYNFSDKVKKQWHTWCIYLYWIIVKKIKTFGQHSR